MRDYEATEQAYKNGYAKGYEDGKKDAVVRCKECKHWALVEDGMGDCTNARFHLDGHPDPTMKMNEYCALGERRDDNG